MKKLLVALGVAALPVFAAAQCNLLDNGVVSGDTLHCLGGDLYRSAVAYHPVYNLYYSVNAGGPAYDEVFDINGVRLDGSNLFDWRGLWYNSLLGTVEGNTWGSGFIVDSLQPNGHLGGNSAMPINAYMPHVQSPGVFDPVDNRIYYYYNGVFAPQNRADGMSLNAVNVALNAPVGQFLNTPLIYNACPGKELGLYNQQLNKIFFFNKNTGALTDSVAMPASVPTGLYTDGHFAFANGQVWFYNLPINKWIGFTIHGGSVSSPAEQELAISIYPNPSTGQFTLSGLVPGQQIQVTDLNGKVIHQSKAVRYQEILELNHATSGVYVLQVQHRSKSFTRKIMLQ